MKTEYEDKYELRVDGDTVYSCPIFDKYLLEAFNSACNEYRRSNINIVLIKQTSIMDQFRYDSIANHFLGKR